MTIEPMKVHVLTEQDRRQQTMTLIADSHGHFHSTITVNGVEVAGLVDTGATLIAMSTATAEMLGISLAGGNMAPMQTANGRMLSLIKVVPRLRVGSFDFDNVAISVSPNAPTLIGMNILGLLKMGTSNGRMVLSRPDHQQRLEGAPFVRRAYLGGAKHRSCLPQHQKKAGA